MNLLKKCRFPFTLQCTYPDSTEEDSFLRLLDLLSTYGFYGVEINLKDLRVPAPERLTARLGTFGLRLTYLATGKYSCIHGYSLSAASPALRRASVEGCRESIEYAAACGCGVIIGYFKNNPAVDTEMPERYLEESLCELAPLARRLGVPLLVEATNHYESKIANSLSQAAALARRVDPQIVFPLPDTYHMNIEESDPLGALEACSGLFPNIHFSDNNRFFPGFGCIDFRRYLRQLEKIHYTGTIGIEGNLKYAYRQDLEITAAYLSDISRNTAPLPCNGIDEIRA